MKPSVTLVLLGAGLIACSHDSVPDKAPIASASPKARPPQIAQVDTAPVKESAPPTSGIPQDPPVAPPAAPPALPPDQTPLTLTPASGAGAARAVSAATSPVGSAPPLGSNALDTAQSPEDRESIREIRALLAADKTLAGSASRVTIVARDGRIWLRGQVNTAEQRAGMERTARRAGGVVDVKNELVVMD